MSDPESTGEKIEFHCASCGARLEYAPGTENLTCQYCGTENEIAPPATKVEEQDFTAILKQAEEEHGLEERLTVKCAACAAESTFEPNVTSRTCPYCGTQIVGQGQSAKLLKPKAILPFSVKRDQAFASFQAWLNGLWFAPNALKRFVRAEGLNGIYAPYWTYDAEVEASYVGQRGEYYYVTQTYTTTVNGKSVTRTRQVRKVRWYPPVSGHVHTNFDDVLVIGSASLPTEKTEALEPWDLDHLQPYRDEYVAGFRVESYTVGLADGFRIAKDKMQPLIERNIRAAIGGDTQRILSMSPDYRNVTFKHVLLPLWLSAFKYRERVFRFLVNARTGEVQGERPWSWGKIALVAGGAAALIAALIALFGR